MGCSFTETTITTITTQDGISDSNNNAKSTYKYIGNNNADNDSQSINSKSNIKVETLTAQNEWLSNNNECQRHFCKHTTGDQQNCLEALNKCSCNCEVRLSDSTATTVATNTAAEAPKTPLDISWKMHTATTATTAAITTIAVQHLSISAKSINDSQALDCSGNHKHNHNHNHNHSNNSSHSNNGNNDRSTIISSVNSTETPVGIDNCKASTIASNNQEPAAVVAEEKQQQEKQQQPHEHESCASTIPTHFSIAAAYRNATAATRNLAATVAAACDSSSSNNGGGGCRRNVQQLLQHARQTLTAQLATLRENMVHYMPVEAFEQRRRQPRKQKRRKQQQQQQQQKIRNSKGQQRRSKSYYATSNAHFCQQLIATPVAHEQHEARQATYCQVAATHAPSRSPQQQLRKLQRNKQAQSHEHHSQKKTEQERNQHQKRSPGMQTSSTTDAPASLTTPHAAFNYIGHNYYHLLRNSISFYAASSVILVLCYLSTAGSAAAANSADTTPADKHPILGIDWSKFDESSSDKEILDLLLEKKRYDKRLLPPVNGTLTVNVNVLLLSLASPDESSLKYEVEFLLNQQWNDPRLQYGNKSHYEFLNALHHHDHIWTPDTYFIMHGDFKDPIIPMHFALRIYRNGTITYAMRRHLILSCQGSLHIFPFDDPKCSFSMESISYEEAQIKYVWKNDEATLRKSPSLTTLNAYLIKNQTTPCDQNSWRGNYSCLQVELTFTRDRAYYFTTVFIPGIILVTSSFITFWLEWNAVPARVMIGVTTMLNFFTTSNGFRSTLPVVSNLTAMNVWDGVCMCFIYASLLEFVCVNYMGRKRPQHNAVYRPGENPVTQRLPAVLSRIGVILASPLEIIEREFHAALSSEKAAVPGTSSTGTATASGTAASTAAVTPTPTPAPLMEMPTSARIRWEEQHGGIIGAAMQNLRARSIRRRTRSPQNVITTTATTTTTISGSDTGAALAAEPIYSEPHFGTTASATASIGAIAAPTATATPTETTVTVEEEESDSADKLRRSISTNTPPLIIAGQQTRIELPQAVQAVPSMRVDEVDNGRSRSRNEPLEVHELTGHLLPVKPPRRKTSRSNSPGTEPYESATQEGISFGAIGSAVTGEKRRDARAPNEIVACTSCGGGSNPCTHSANNGCATETCFAQVRKKEPPHPIRIAKTIDVVARITFPIAYSIFLIFFFVHYKGFS